MNRFFIDWKGYPRWIDSKALVHRTVAATKVGGRIFSKMIVHHIDGNKLNFRKNNLWFMTRSAHSMLHAQKRTAMLLLKNTKKLTPAIVVISTVIAVLGLLLKTHSKNNQDRG